jgi:phage-related holin
MEVRRMQIDWGIWIKVAAASIAAVWGGLTPLVQLLLILMALDVVTGFLAGFVSKELSSECSFAGMAKKAIV